MGETSTGFLGERRENEKMHIYFLRSYKVERKSPNMRDTKDKQHQILLVECRTTWKTLGELKRLRNMVGINFPCEIVALGPELPKANKSILISGMVGL